MFQSTRPCGARLVLQLIYNLQFAFQSTRPCGARHQTEALIGDLSSVSIHAPMRGATYNSSIISTASTCFNPRAHAGRDEFENGQQECISRFNPRAHAGRDGCLWCGLLCWQVSIHAPMRGATLWGMEVSYTIPVSIHAPMRGATLRRQNQ